MFFSSLCSYQFDCFLLSIYSQLPCLLFCEVSSFLSLHPCLQPPRNLFIYFLVFVLLWWRSALSLEALNASESFFPLEQTCFCVVCLRVSSLMQWHRFLSSVIYLYKYTNIYIRYFIAVILVCRWSLVRKCPTTWRELMLLPETTSRLTRQWHDW